MAAGEAGGSIQSDPAKHSNLSAWCRHPIGIHFFCAEYSKLPQANLGTLLSGRTRRIRLAACERQGSSSAFGQFVRPVGRQPLRAVARSDSKDARLIYLA